MRKISIFSLLVILISSLSFGLFNASASGWNWSSSDAVADKPHFCTDGAKCTLDGGLEAAKSAMGSDVTDKGVVEFSQDIVVYLLGFISLIAVCLILWSGFRILTSGGDEKAMEDSKKTITYIALGMILMWLAYAIVNWIMSLLDQTAYTDWKKTHYAFNLIPTANAQAYTESEIGTFAAYRYQVLVAAEKMEAELKVNKTVSAASISEMRSLIQQAFDRLPDKNVDAARENESNKRLVDMYLDLAAKEPNSQQAVGQAISQAANFARSAKIETIQGSISATPASGNAPLVTSFSAQNVIDPSGTIPTNQDYIWWIRENGGKRRELGRGPSLTHEFTQEGTYTVNLDVTSASRNSKGRVDVLPLSTSVNVQVLPKLGEITLLINGINVSNMNEIKITPAIASQGLIFDATASRAIGNGRILETKWEFDNGNSRTYKSAPGVERQIFATAGTYNVKLSFTTNDGKNFSKDITLRIIDPAATIKATKTTANAGETLSFSAETFFGNVKNVEYVWMVQSNDTGKRETQSGNGTGFSYTFDKIGSYTVTLMAKSPNGDRDEDSKTITVESREPVATLDSPKQINSEKPNTFIFDASRSFDPDTNTRQGLTYTWRINGELVTLDEIDGTNADQKGSKGSLTFDSIGENTISVTVSNQYGKIATAEQKFSVTSVLSGNMLITPQVTQVGKSVTFIAQAKNAQFYTWNMGDGSPQKAGNARTIQHTFERTGVYNVSLILQGADNTTTTIGRKVYVTDMDSPFAVIDFSNASNSVIQQAGVCDGKDAYILKRGESTQINGGKSINVDGSNSNLDYTWQVMGKPSTLANLSENFKDLGCFPISLTVKSKTNGASHTTVEYIKLENQLPTLTNISTTLDASKQDSQKVIVKARANGVSDPDGVITSYIWYYTTASDEEPQGLQITQKPEMTFVLPNITEKYYFGVIIEDNDGSRVDSKEILSSNAPLIIDNENSNVHLPLITLTANNKIVKIGQPVNISAQVKTILGTDVTSKAQYSWDFDGDGRIDERSSTSSISHTFQKAGEYKVRVRVTNNGVSNTKTINIIVRNELKAGVQGYRLPNDQLYLLNTSVGVYDKAQWKIGEHSYTTLDNITLDFDSVPTADEKGSIGTLKVWSNDTENSSTDIILRDIQFVEQWSDDSINFQSFPKAENDTITITDPSQSLKISLFGNNAEKYAIDADLSIDSNLDGVSDNDVDNQETASYTNGSLFVISDFATTKTRERKIKLTTYKGTTPLASKTLTVILDFISETPTQTNFSVIDTQELTDFEKERLETLASMIRGLGDSDRIALMQKYNVLVENWMSPFEKAKNLVDLQTLVFERPNIDESTKQSFSNIVDQLLINDADATNAVTVAITLIRGLIPTNSANYVAMIEKVDAIASHPTDSATNKTLGEELLVMIQQEPSDNLADDYKILIRDQIKLILEKGDASKVAVDTKAIEKTNNSDNQSGGIMGFFKSIGTIILWILAIIFGVILLLFLWYKLQSKDENLGFQDFIIERVSGKSASQETTTVAPIIAKTEIKEEKKADEDPLKAYTPPAPVATTTENASDPLSGNTDGSMPDWLNPQNDASEKISQNISESTPATENTGGLPSWLTGANTSTTEIKTSDKNSFDPLSADNNSSEKISQNISENTTENTEDLPEWMKPEAETMPTNTEIPENTTPESTGGLPDWLNPDAGKSENVVENSANNENLPDWLKPLPTTEAENISENISKNTPEDTNAQTEELPDWLKSSDSEDAAENSQGNGTENFENISENASEAEDSLPDWLTNSSEEITETTTEENSLPDWLSENTPETTESTENSDELPDWIKNSTENESSDTSLSQENFENISEENSEPFANFETNNSLDPFEVMAPENFDENNFSYTATKTDTSNDEIIPESENSDELPDWLRESAEQISETVENTSDNIIAEAKNIQKNLTETATETIQNASEAPVITEGKKTLQKTAKAVSNAETSLPDWLKDETEIVTEKTIEQKFEEKLEAEEKKKADKKPSNSAQKSDDNIPEWLK